MIDKIGKCSLELPLLRGLVAITPYGVAWDEIPSTTSRRGNSDKSPKKEKFQGACTKLIDHIFEAGANRSAQISTYTTSMEAIKNYVAINYDPHVLQ